MIDWSTVKEGEIIFRFGLSKWGGRIWELSRTRVKIVKINDKTIRINRIDDNDGHGNEWAAKKVVLEKEKGQYARSYEELYDIALPNLDKLRQAAKKNLEGFTDQHPNYGYYVYTAKILEQFYVLLRDGFTEEKYKSIKQEHQEIEHKLTNQLFGID